MDGQDIYEPDTKETLTSQSVPKPNEEKDTPFGDINSNMQKSPERKQHNHIASSPPTIDIEEQNLYKGNRMTNKDNPSVQENPLRRSSRPKTETDYSNNGAHTGTGGKAFLTTNTFAYLTHLESIAPKHPKNIDEANKHEKSVEYKKSILKEMHAHLENKTYEEIDLKDVPKGSNIINTGMVYAIKTDSISKKEIIKSRLVAKGCGQKYGVDFSETYAPTVDPITIRMAIAWAAQRKWCTVQLDVKTAFLIPELPKHEIVYSRPPKGYAIIQKWLGRPVTDEKTTIMRWTRSVYGLCQSMNLWHKYLGAVLRTLGYIQQNDDPCLYIRRDEKGIINNVLLYHVDDILCFSANQSNSDQAVKELETILLIKNLGRPEKFLGVEFKYQPNGDILLHQQSYTKELLTRFGWENVTPADSPTKPNRLSKIGTPISVDIPYREAIGALLWLAIMTRPDILFGVIELAQFTTSPTTEHWENIKLKFRYLKKTSNYGIWIKQSKTPRELRLWASSDADWAAAEDRSSTGGFLIFWKNVLIGWECKKIKSACMSSCESEIVTMSRTARSLRWIRRIVKTLDNKFPDCIDLLCDNQGAIDISRNGIRSRRVRHIELHNMYIQQAEAEGWLACVWVSTTENPSDCMTKPYGPQKFKHVPDILQLR